MVYLNCGLPAPPGTPIQTPVVPLLPDLSHLASTTNLGGAANPNIAQMASGSGSGSGSGSNSAQSELNVDTQDDSGGLDAAELADAMGSMSDDLASNPWVNPNSLNGPDDSGGSA